MAVEERPLDEVAAWLRQHAEAALEPDLPIIDCHHHFWIDARGRYLFDELAADLHAGHNILSTVYVQTGQTMYRRDGPAELRSIGEVEFANGMAAIGESGLLGKTRFCAGIVGFADLRLGDGIEPVLDELVAAGNGRLKGIRHNMVWDPVNEGHHTSQIRHLALDASFRKGLSHLSQKKLSFDAWIFYPQLDELIDLVRAFPDTAMILNHVGGILGVGPHAGRRTEIFDVWRTRMRELSQFQNLSVKIGGFGMPRCGWNFHLRDKPASSVELAAAWKPYVETCIDLFGPGRCMMESNFPVDMCTAGYGVIWNAYKRITASMNRDEKDQLYRGTASRVYRLALEA